MSVPEVSKTCHIVIVLGNAGIKSLAALPILQFLHQEKMNVNLMIGSGGGATLAGLISSGYSFEEIPKLMADLYARKNIMKYNYRTLLEITGIPIGRFTPANSLLQKDVIYGIYKDVFKENQFEDMQIPLQIQSTDIYSGEGYVLQEGSIADALYASSAIYPFLPPIKIGEKWLMDGMYSSVLPVLQATNQGAKSIIAIDFSRSHNALPHGLVEYYANSMNRTYGTMQTSQVSMAMMLHDIEMALVKISFPDPINLWDEEFIDAILEAGRKALEVHREELFVCFNP